ncbi:hypothetical protein [Atlantibacter hermannii]|uniref:hypothetical protein n=1 Tax=Atlantibacter hermannii TaxID=565 RepID=UPI0028AF64EE|nr:hypothetical protein [Atlantibacter hermannii]MDU7814690.1 hypothetical protein [Atlantibacter hermannii]
MDKDIERIQLEHLSDHDLEQKAFDLGLIDESVSIEECSDEFVEELIGRIIEAEAYATSQDEEWDTQQQIIEQQKLDDRFSD